MSGATVSNSTESGAATRGELELVVPRLHATSPEPLPFAPSLEIRAFLLERERGNILIYSTTGLERDAEGIERLGGISRHYLNHWHEAMFASDWVRAPLFVHEDDRAKAEEAYDVRGTFSRRHTLDDDFEAIPISGHTAGATAYLWDSGKHRMLFTGDSVYLDRASDWVAAVLGSSNRPAYLESLKLIRELDFDLLVPWAAPGGNPFVAATDGDDARRRIDAIIDRVRAGGDS
jgi:glyoxylase-like metal-dependent hydrolase (beta-lactamase superfamily II)